MQNEPLLRKFVNLSKKLTRQITEGTTITVNNNAVSVKIKQNNKTKTINAININLTYTNQKAIVFYDIDTNKYYAWSQTEKETKETVIQYIRQRLPIESPSLKLAISYVFSLTCYYDFSTQTWQDTRQTLEIERMYDHNVAIQPIQFNQRRLYTGLAPYGAYFSIQHDIDEHYDLSLPYHKPTLEIYRTNKCDYHDGTLIGGFGGGLDNRSVAASDIYGYYKAYNLAESDPNNQIVQRIGGYRHYKYLDNIYPHNAIEYQSDIFLDHTYQSSLTGQAMTQVISAERTAYEMLPSSLPYFAIAIWDYGVNGKPATDYYGSNPNGYPPAQSRLDPHTWHRLTINVMAHNLGLGGLFYNEHPLILNMPIYLPSLQECLHITGLTKNKFLINIKSSLISLLPLLANDDKLLEYQRSLSFDMGLNARFYGVNDNNVNAIAPYYCYPHGSNTYILIEWDSLNTQYKIIGLEMKQYPQSIVSNNSCTIQNIDPTLPSHSIPKSKVWNYYYIFNYIGNKGIGYHKYNSHYLNVLNNSNLGSPNIDLDFHVLKNVDRVTPAGYQSVINYYQNHGGFPIINYVYDPNSIIYGLKIYEDNITTLINTKNPNNKLNFMAHPNYSESLGQKCLVPQFASYWENVLTDQLALGIDNELIDSDQQMENWRNHGYSFMFDQDTDVVTYLPKFDYAIINSQWGNYNSTLSSFKKKHTIKSCHLDTLFPFPNEAIHNSFRLITFFPYYY